MSIPGKENPGSKMAQIINPGRKIVWSPENNGEVAPE